MKYTPTEEIIRQRIRVSIAAWAYEQGDLPIMSDHDYDSLSNIVDSSRFVPTGCEVEDRFFKEHFDRSTGMWVHKHPNLLGIQNLYLRYWKSKSLK